MTTYDDDDLEPISSDQLNSLMLKRTQQDYLRERRIRELALKPDLALADWEEVTGSGPDENEHDMFTVSEEGVSAIFMGAQAQRVVDPEVREFHARRALSLKLSFPCTASALLAFVDRTEGAFTVHPSFRSVLGYLTSPPTTSLQSETPSENALRARHRSPIREDVLAREISEARQRLATTGQEDELAAVWNELRSQAGKGHIVSVTSAYIEWRRDSGDTEVTKRRALKDRLSRLNRAK